MRLPHHRLQGPAWCVGPPWPGAQSGRGPRVATAGLGPWQPCPQCGLAGLGADPLHLALALLRPVGLVTASRRPGPRQLPVRGRGWRAPAWHTPRRVPHCDTPPPYPPTGCGSFSGSFLEYYAADISESELVLVCVAHEQGAGGFWAEGGSPGARGLQGPGHCLLLPARGRGALHAEPIPLAGASVVSPGGQNTRRLPLTALGPVSSVVTATPPPLMQDGQSEPPGGPRPACRCWTRVEGSVAGRGASCQRRALRGPLRPGAQ